MSEAQAVVLGLGVGFAFVLALFALVEFRPEAVVWLARHLHWINPLFWLIMLGFFGGDLLAWGLRSLHRLLDAREGGVRR